MLLGNILRWMAPEVFRDVDVATQSAGAVSAPAPAEHVDRNTVQVLTDSGTVLPFNIRDRAVQFFAGEPARVRVIAGNSERVFSLTLPEMWDAQMDAPVECPPRHPGAGPRRSGAATFCGRGSRLGRRWPCCWPSG